MNIAFRLDASPRIGGGHAMRCLTLADELARREARIVFIVRDLPEWLAAELRKRGFEALSLPEVPDEDGTDLWERDADATLRVLRATGRSIDQVVVDHYGLDHRWERRIAESAGRVVVIDDLADRAHHCDILLDQNLYPDAENRYRSLLPSHCRQLLGLRYALLRPEFARTRGSLRRSFGRIERAFVFFGTGDADNETGKFLNGMSTCLDGSWEADVVVGASNPHRAAIEALAVRAQGVRIHHQPCDIPQLMANADLAFGAGGSITWERFCLGVPSVVTAIAENQRQSCEYLARRGLIRYLGDHVRVEPEQYRSSFLQLAAATTERKRLSTEGLHLVDGLGASRVADTLMA